MSTGDEARILAQQLGISVTRARRALMIGVEEEQRQYDNIHKPEENKIKKSAKAVAYHDRLYAQALALASDEDDIDVVEHYCQGHIDRLKTFIEARKNQHPIDD